MLRVVRSAAGESAAWDALDQPEDQPLPRETIFVYCLATKPTVMFLDYRTKGGRRRGHREAVADYRAWPSPPPVEILRNAVLWQEWCKRLEASPEGAALLATLKGETL